MQILDVETSARAEFVDITAKVQAAAKADAGAAGGAKRGVVHVFVPHTTAGVTINENADPAVTEDIIAALERTVPWEAGYRHGEGNSAAHVKASMMGFSAHVPLEAGRLVLGTWQAVYFCEFDGPRSRKCYVQVVPC